MTLLPRNSNEISAAIASTARQGSSAISKLVTLCLWKVSQRIDPATSYVSPGNYKPLAYLEEVLAHPDGGKLNTGSMLADTMRRYPRPTTTRPTQIYSDNEARTQVRAKMDEALAAIHPLRRDHLIIEAATELAGRGFKKALLQPLIDLLVRMEVEPKYHSLPFGLIEALLNVEESAVAFQKVESIPISLWTGVSSRLDLARRLIARGRSAEARQIVQNVLANRAEWTKNLLPTGDPELPVSEIAKIYVYLGEYQTAHALIQNNSKGVHLALESQILINDYLNERQLNSGPVISFYPEYKPGNLSPKGTAAAQCGILELLIDVQLVDDALKTLPSLFKTLHHVGLWSKFEFRTRDVAIALAPINRAEAIFPFVRDLLIAKSEPQSPEDFWWIVHAISGVVPLIARWSSQQDYQELIDFTRRTNL